MSCSDRILPYTIADSTPHSGKYRPENILLDRPHDQTSRWSGAHPASGKQWILLRLESPAILKQIKFGKLSKSHPCTLKDFKVYIGMMEDKMTQVLHSSLKVSVEPETFDIPHLNKDGVAFPTQFVKIEPINAQKEIYHISIWHVALWGTLDGSYVERLTMNYEEHQETMVLRHILKHLRQLRLLSPFQAVLERANIHLENPLVTKLHESLVLKGDWKRAEQLLQSMADADLFDEYIRTCHPQAVWTRLMGTNEDGDIPSPRGGHAMCLDPDNELIYMLGGYDGQTALDDFWVYSIREDKWKVLSHSTTGEHNAPGRRSCHRMAFDVKTGNIYVLGCLEDAEVRAPGGSTRVSALQQAYFHPQQSPLRQQFNASSGQPSTSQNPSATVRTYLSEMNRYVTRGIDAGKWTVPCFDVAEAGGPPLIYDHEMVIDSESQIMYVYGGRIIDGDWNNASYAGLYSYNLRTSKWKPLQHADSSSSSTSHIIPPRHAHSMVLEPKEKKLYIFGGQRGGAFLSDMHVYDIKTSRSTELCPNTTKVDGPDPSFSPRALIDPKFKEIYISCGLIRPAKAGKETKINTMRSTTSYWTFRYGSKKGQWFPLSADPDASDETPPLRFGHQAVYHAPTRRIFVHGGNPGIEEKGGSSSQTAAGTAGAGSSVAGGVGNADASVSASVQPSPSPPSSEGVTPAAVGATATATHEVAEQLKQPRLDDLWMMELKRPEVSEIIRQAKFHIRRQQFREMCEQESPVKALQFLQTEVSSVVCHEDSSEAETFRSLLTHLLAPSSTQASALSLPARLSRRDKISSTMSSRDPSSDISEKWTDRLPGDEEEGQLDADGDISMVDSEHERRTVDMLRGLIDPLEIEAARRSLTGGGRDEGDDRTAVSNGDVMLGPASLTSQRYKQRTEVFDCLLRFVGEGDKEPVGSLLDLVNQDGVDGVVDSAT